MAFNSKVFQIVNEMFLYQEGGCHILFGHAFPLERENCAEDLNGGIFVVNGSGSAFVEQPGIGTMYIPTKGRFWIIEDPRKFPAPPFLLTNDRRYRQIFDGEVVIQMTGPAEEDVQDELTRNEIDYRPVMDGKMIGVARISSIITHLAMLVAYSTEIDCLPEKMSDLRSGEGDLWQPFGSISLNLADPG